MIGESQIKMRSNSSDTIAMIVEIVFGFFGMLGMGWLYAGNIPVAVALFVGFGVLALIEASIITATLGLALCLIVPFNLVVAIISGLRARDFVRNAGATGSILYLVAGLVIGSIVICGGIMFLVVGLGAIGAALG